jgi:hypothetical protein
MKIIIFCFKILNIVFFVIDQPPSQKKKNPGYATVAYCCTFICVRTYVPVYFCSCSNLRTSIFFRLGTYACKNLPAMLRVGTYHLPKKLEIC